MPFHSPRISSSSKSSALEWKCPFCGAMNEEDNMVCDGCGDPRPTPGASGPKRAPSTNTSKEAERDDLFGSSKDFGTDLNSDRDFEDSKDSPDSKDSTAKGKFDFDDNTDEDEDLEESPKTPEPLDRDTDTDADSQDFDASTVITSPLASSTGSSDNDEDDSITQTPAPIPSLTSQSPSGPTLSGQRLALVFVNTPAASLVKTRVGIEFDVFPAVSIGRNPENVVVVPDPEVSRNHAQLSLEGGKIILKDLKSANGTFVYDGKQFQRVNGSVEVKPNTILKFGSGTIVRLVSE